MLALEIIASVSGVLCVALLIYRNHWSWPIGLVQVILTGFILWKSKLYAETALQVVFALLQLYGWWAWLVSLKTPSTLESVPELVRIERLTPAGTLVWLTVTAGGTVIISWFLISFTDGKSPEMDAFITSSSLVAQYLLAARFIENWTYWIVVDIFSIPLYFSRELYAFGALYIIFLGLAIGGLLSWRNALRRQVSLARDAL